MKKNFPLIAVVVAAVAALVLGSFGTAVAAKPITKSVVKKLAKKEIAKAAPTLSVDNAAKLNGQAPSAYQSRIAYSINTVATPIPAATPTQLNSATITVQPGVSFLHLSGRSSIASAAGAVYFTVDAVCGFGVTRGAQVGTGAVDSAFVEDVLPTTAGVHTVRLCAAASGASQSFISSLTVETVANGSTGGSTL